jgi:hypothetical protein
VTKVVSVSGGSLTNAALLLHDTPVETAEDLQLCLAQFAKRITVRKFGLSEIAFLLKSISIFVGWGLLWMLPISLKWVAPLALSTVCAQGWLRIYMRYRTHGILGAKSPTQVNELTRLVPAERRHIFTVSSVGSGSPMYHVIGNAKAFLTEDSETHSAQFNVADHRQQLLDVVQAGSTFPALCWPEVRRVPFQVRSFVARIKTSRSKQAAQQPTTTTTSRYVLSWDGGINGLFGTRIDPLLSGDHDTNFSRKIDSELGISEPSSPHAIRFIVDGGKFPRKTEMLPFLMFIPIIGSLVSMYRALMVSIMSLTNVDREIARTHRDKNVIHYIPVCGGSAMFPVHPANTIKVDWLLVRDSQRLLATPLGPGVTQTDLLHRRLGLQAELKRRTDKIGLRFRSQQKLAAFAIASGVTATYETMADAPTLRELRAEIDETFRWLGLKTPNSLVQLLDDFTRGL